MWTAAHLFCCLPDTYKTWSQQVKFEISNFAFLIFIYLAPWGIESHSCRPGWAPTLLAQDDSELLACLLPFPGQPLLPGFI